MKQNAYTVYDEKAQAFLPPFFMHQDGMATRTFADCVNDADHNFGKHPHDYTLFQIGSFDDNTGELTATEKKSLGNGVEFRAKRSNMAEGDQMDLEDITNTPEGKQ